MGKHEVVKPAGSTSTGKSTDRVRKHREAMRAKGYVLKQRWVIDMDNPEVRERIKRECAEIAAFERANPEEFADLNYWHAHQWDDLPDYDWK
jgi:hypothetical protein